MRRGSTRGLSRGDRVHVKTSTREFDGVIRVVDRGQGEVFVETSDGKIARLLPSCVRKVTS